MKLPLDAAERFDIYTSGANDIQFADGGRNVTHFY